MIDTISEDAIIAPQRKTFQNSPIDCFFYTIAPPNKGEMESELRSFSTFTYQNKNFPVIVKDLSVSNINIHDFRRLAYIWNLELLPARFTRCAWEFWENILEKGFDGLGATNESLKRFTELIDLPFEVQENVPVTINNRRLRSFIQYLTPIRIAFIEGNHRMDLACRTFYGYDIKGIDGTLQETAIPNGNSTICLEVDTIVTVAISNKNNILDRFVLKSLRDRSAYTQDLKKQIIETTWQEFVKNMAEYLNGKYENDDSYLKHLFNQPMIRTKKKTPHPLEVLTSNILNEIIVQLWSNAPAMYELPSMAKNDGTTSFFSQEEFKTELKTMSLKKSKESISTTEKKRERTTKWFTSEPSPISQVSLKNTTTLSLLQE